MTRIDDLHYMLQFVNAKGKIIYPHEENYDLIIGEWANLIRRQHRKGLIPLFITGSGVSAEAGVPTILKIVDKLYELYQSKNKEGLRDLSIDIEYLFKMLHSPAGQRKRTSRFCPWCGACRGRQRRRGCPARSDRVDSLSSPRAGLGRRKSRPLGSCFVAKWPRYFAE